MDEDRSKKKWSDMGKERQQTLTNAAKPKRRESKKSRLLANPDVKRWFDNVARGSPITAEVRVRRLGQFCEIHEMTPMQVAELGMKDLMAVTDLLQDHVTWMEQQNYAPQYTKSTVTALKSWLSHFDVEIKRKIWIANIDSTPTLENERVPNGEEMGEIFARMPLREGSSVSLIAKAGLRPEVLGNHDGTDGLMMKDLPDIAIVQGVARCLASPPMVIVRKALSKAGHQYFTFLTSNGTKRLLADLNDRLARGEPLNAESPVISPNATYHYGRGRNSKKKFLPTVRVSDAIRESLRPRFTWRPYVFRSYFDTQLLIAEARGKIAHDFRVFFMGHKGSIEAKYTTNKGVLPEALIREMREAFKRSEEFLDLEGNEVDPLTKQREVIQTAIAKATPEQLGRMQEMLRSLGVGNIIISSSQAGSA
ncbi:MAG: site-specific integrase [Thermoproteota archaeon]